MQMIWIMIKCGYYLIYNNNLPDSMATARTTSTFMMMFTEKNNNFISVLNMSKHLCVRVK